MNIDNLKSVSSSSLIFAESENGFQTKPLKLSAQDSLQVSIKEPLSGFGELISTQLHPRIQLSAAYGLVETDVENFSATGGSVSATENLFSCQSGTSIGGFGVIRSRRLITYRPGQSVKCRFTAMFTPGVANSLQGAGLFTATNGIFIGYNGAQFGIWLRRAGKTAIYRLTFTIGTGGNETHSITMNGVLYTVNTTGVLTTARLAEEIAENIAATPWASSVSPKSNGATITFIQSSPAPISGAFSYSSSGTATASFTQLQSGLANDDTTFFVPQSQFNYDRLDGTSSDRNPTGELLDPTKLNVYQITYPHLGAGSITFSRFDSEGHAEIFHIIEYTNRYTVPSQLNPSYRVGWIAASLGSTTNLTVKGASAAAFIEGETVSLRFPYSYDNSITAGTTEYVVLALRNRGEFSNTSNQKQFQLLSCSAGLETANRICTISIRINPVLTGAVGWNYVDQTNSCVEYATPTNLTPSGGIVIQSFVIASSPTIVDLEKLGVRLSPADVISISASTLSGSSGVKVSINWAEL